MTQQVPVLIEPIVILLLPVVYFFSPGSDLKCRLYFLCVLIWTVATWSLFGGAITRIAAVQVARGDKIGLVDALRLLVQQAHRFLPDGAVVPVSVCLRAVDRDDPVRLAVSDSPIRRHFCRRN